MQDPAPSWRTLALERNKELSFAATQIDRQQEQLEDNEIYSSGSKPVRLVLQSFPDLKTDVQRVADEADLRNRFFYNVVQAFPQKYSWIRSPSETLEICPHTWKTVLELALEKHDDVAMQKIWIKYGLLALLPLSWRSAQGAMPVTKFPLARLGHDKQLLSVLQEMFTNIKAFARYNETAAELLELSALKPFFDRGWSCSEAG